jgi:hypothetical protein
MRFNKIFAGPVSETLPQVVEAPAAADDLKPGNVVTFVTGGEFDHAGATTGTQLFVVQDNYLAMLGTDDAYEDGESVIGMIPLDEQFFACRFAASTAVVKGDAIALAANGLLRKLPTATGSYIVVGYSDETVTLGAAAEDLIRVRWTQPRQVTV